METITAEDITEANQDSLAQIARAARVVSAAVVIAGSIGVLAWLWYVTRAQMEAGGGLGFTFGANDGDASLTDRIDLVATTSGLLVQSAIALGIGVTALLWSSRVYASMGHSLHGVTVGDPLPRSDEDSE